jgi:GH18 family chitinase
MSRCHSKFIYAGKTWIAYEDHEAVDLKAKFVLNTKLAGLMFYSLNADDFSAHCSLPFPLITQAKKIFDENKSDDNENNMK